MAGTDRFDTDILTRFAGRLIVKGGAEGVFCAGFPEQGVGVALKCDDGAGRAAETVMAAMIAAILPLDGAARAAFADRLTPPIRNRVGLEVGSMRIAAGAAEAIRVS